jgi:acetyl-CoA C-acetyltransferase
MSTEIVLKENFGSAERGKSWRSCPDGTFNVGGYLPVNPDLGLKSLAHLIDASGLRLLFEAWLQLRGEAGYRPDRHRRSQPCAHPEARHKPSAYV